MSFAQRMEASLVRTVQELLESQTNNSIHSTLMKHGYKHETSGASSSEYSHPEKGAVTVLHPEKKGWKGWVHRHADPKSPNIASTGKTSTSLHAHLLNQDADMKGVKHQTKPKLDDDDDFWENPS